MGEKFQDFFNDKSMIYVFIKRRFIFAKKVNIM